MIKLNIHEAKTHLSRYLEKVLKGEVVVLCKNNHPLAELRRLEQPRKSKRPIGLDKGRVVVPESFFEPLPDSVLRSFMEPF